MSDNTMPGRLELLLLWETMPSQRERVQETLGWSASEVRYHVNLAIMRATMLLARAEKEATP